MHKLGYTNLHIADGSIGMLQHALKHNVYKTYHRGIIPKDGVPEYLLDAGKSPLTLVDWKISFV